MKNKPSAIPVRELAKIIDVHRNTIFAWLCHYSLAKYSYQVYTPKGTVETMFKLNRDSLFALKKYLSKKHTKYLTFLEYNMDKIKKYYS